MRHTAGLDVKLCELWRFVSSQNSSMEYRHLTERNTERPLLKNSRFFIDEAQPTDINEFYVLIPFVKRHLAICFLFF